MFFNSKVIKIEQNKLHLKSKRTIQADLMIWTAGITASKEIENFGLAHSKDGIYVNKYLQTISNPHVYALGDCISFKKGNLIKRAQNAIIQAKIAARNISNDILNKKRGLMFLEMSQQ